VSQENVELIRRIYTLFDAGKSARELIDDDLEYVNPPYAVESGTKRGRKMLGAIREVYPDYRFEAQEYRDAGEEVAVLGVAHGTAASGVHVEWRQGHLWSVRDGRAVRFSWFSDPSEALQAAGLEE
jgi:ketosteroid isomerase-like protein